MSAERRAPRGLGPSGRRLWRSITEGFELSEAEKVLLLEACHTADICAKLQTTASELDTPSPVLTELRMQRQVLARLIAALRVPDDNAPQRGPFHLRGGSMRPTS